MVYGVMNSMNARYFDVDNFLRPQRTSEDPGVSRSTCIPLDLTHPFFMMKNGRKYIVSPGMGDKGRV